MHYMCACVTSKILTHGITAVCSFNWPSDQVKYRIWRSTHQQIKHLMCSSFQMSSDLFQSNSSVFTYCQGNTDWTHHPLWHNLLKFQHFYSLETHQNTVKHQFKIQILRPLHHCIGTVCSSCDLKQSTIQLDSFVFFVHKLVKSVMFNQL